MAFLARKPELDLGAMEFARAYAALSTTRQIGMGLGPIDIRAVWEWEDRNGIDDPMLRRHVEAVLSAIDTATLKRANRPPDRGGDNKP